MSKISTFKKDDRGTGISTIHHNTEKADHLVW